MKFKPLPEMNSSFLNERINARSLVKSYYFEEKQETNIQTLSVRFTRYLFAPVELLGRLSYTENPEK